MNHTITFIPLALLAGSACLSLGCSESEPSTPATGNGESAGGSAPLPAADAPSPAGEDSPGGMPTEPAGSGGLGPDSGGAQSAGGSSEDGGNQPPDAGAEPVDGAVVLSSNELIFSGPRGVPSRVETVTLDNQTSAAVTLDAVELSGEHATLFELVDPPATSIEPGEMLQLELVFHPTEPGVRTATLRLESGAFENGPLQVGLFGLGARGLEGSNEPPIQDVLLTLGFDIDLGSDEFHLPTSAALIGEEVSAQRFQRAAPGPVGLRPVARYSPDEALPYGFYTQDGTLNEVGVIAEGQHQSLNPRTEPGSELTFDPGGAAFGIYTESKVHVVYTEDERNTGNVAHAVRTYALKDRDGTAVPGSFLVCFEEASNGDYQDYIFVLDNAIALD